MLYCVVTTPSRVSFHHQLFTLCPLLLPLAPFPSGNQYTVVPVHLCGGAGAQGVIKVRSGEFIKP